MIITVSQGIIFVLIMLAAYFMGSIPTGVIIGKKFKGIDIRNEGSKNIICLVPFRYSSVRY